MDYCPLQVVDAMREIGSDLRERKPQRLTDVLAQWADVVVTMGCGDASPYSLGKGYIDWDLPNPSGRPIDEVRQTRDRIAGLTQELAGELDGGRGRHPQ